MNIVFPGLYRRLCFRATLYYQLDIYFLCTLYFVIELLLERTGYSVWIDLLYFGYFLSAQSVWFYQRVDLLHFGHCPYLEVENTVVQTL